MEARRIPGKLLKLTQAAAVLQCHPKTLRLMAQAGRSLPAASANYALFRKPVAGMDGG